MKRLTGISFHCYASDNRMYMLDDVKAWMAIHFLSFNVNKTEVIIFGGTNGTRSLSWVLWPIIIKQLSLT